MDRIEIIKAVKNRFNIAEMIKAAMPTVNEVRELVEKHNNGTITVYERVLLAKHVRRMFSRMSGKLENVKSISTSPLINPHCLQRMADGSKVCAHCYSYALNKYRRNLPDKLIRNTLILTSVVIPVEYWPVFIDGSMLRFESYGDLLNEKQCANYVNACMANSRSRCALWTKNPFIFDDYMCSGGVKPSNLNIVYSSENFDACDDVIACMYPFIDSVFTVYRSMESAGNNKINCGAASCASCGLCYNKGAGLNYINELLKMVKRPHSFGV